MNRVSNLKSLSQAYKELDRGQRKSRQLSGDSGIKLEINGTATFGKQNTLDADNISDDHKSSDHDYEPFPTGILCSTGPMNEFLRQELPPVDELGSGNLEELGSLRSVTSPSQFLGNATGPSAQNNRLMQNEAMMKSLQSTAARRP